MLSFRREQPSVRGPAHRYDLADREPLGQLTPLLCNGNSLRDLAPAQPVQQYSVQHHPPPGWSYDSGEYPDQGRLSRPVGTQQSYDLARAQVDINTLQQLLLTRIQGDARRPQFTGTSVAAHARPSRLSNHRKNGPPMRAVTTPIGTSAGAMTVRAARSATTVRVAPAQAASGRSDRWPAPKARRTA